ncbi:MAG: NhaC family Na+:H+ antiporter [Woeseiaceae bacterium]|jgi:NhaC family Na+:H+ antiporter|tara:strand:+ start:53758 stop:55206 length:1449 start_codon:yes stop_codon:yes gene_type:complete
MSEPRQASLLESLIPIMSLVFMLGFSVFFFGSDSSYGPNQIALIIGAAIASLVAIKIGHTWSNILESMVASISTAMGALLIFLCVGALIGTWLISGTVPTLIFYGLELLNPKIFYPAACLICAIAALATGSSWTVAGTLGVALIAVSIGLNLSPAIAAGAIISGAYFGDKMSPLSDTTNLAPAVTGTDLFAHIKHMVWTTTPSFLLALVIFMILGFGVDSDIEDSTITLLTETLDATFNITLLALLPLLVVFLMAIRKIPALPTILFGALLGGVMAFFLQPEAVMIFADSNDLSPTLSLIKGIWLALATGYTSATGIPEIDSLLSRGGMQSMLNTMWLVISAMSFGAVLEHAGMLKTIISSSLKAAKSTGSLITTVILSCISINIVCADQYISIVLAGKMFKAEFKKRNLDPKNLSRVIEDSGTLTSPLVPWNTCGAYMAATLGVPTFTYLPYVFFNLINPVISMIYGFTGFTIEKLDKNKG